MSQVHRNATVLVHSGVLLPLPPLPLCAPVIAPDHGPVAAQYTSLGHTYL